MGRGEAPPALCLPSVPPTGAGEQDRSKLEQEVTKRAAHGCGEAQMPAQGMKEIFMLRPRVRGSNERRFQSVPRRFGAAHGCGAPKLQRLELCRCRTCRPRTRRQAGKVQ